MHYKEAFPSLCCCSARRLMLDCSSASNLGVMGTRCCCCCRHYPQLRCPHHRGSPSARSLLPRFSSPLPGSFPALQPQALAPPRVSFWRPQPLFDNLRLVEIGALPSRTWLERPPMLRRRYRISFYRLHSATSFAV